MVAAGLVGRFQLLHVVFEVLGVVASNYGTVYGCKLFGDILQKVNGAAFGVGNGNGVGQVAFGRGFDVEVEGGSGSVEVQDELRVGAVFDGG